MVLERVQTMLVVSRAAQMFAAEHQLDLERLSRKLRKKCAPFIGIRDVERAVAKRRNRRRRQEQLKAILEMNTNEIRVELTDRKIKCSFLGSDHATLRKLLLDSALYGRDPPLQFMHKDYLESALKRCYEDLISRVTLSQLAAAFPDPLWQHYMKHGWVKYDLGLTAKEKRMINLCHRVALCELGVQPDKPATYKNAMYRNAAYA
jgi:hypothetical protein